MKNSFFRERSSHLVIPYDSPDLIVSLKTLTHFLPALHARLLVSARKSAIPGHGSRFLLSELLTLPVLLDNTHIRWLYISSRRMFKRDLDREGRWEVPLQERL